jgi:hypothetical protein
MRKSMFLIFIFSFFGNIPCQADISTGLVGWWKFDEASSGTCGGANILDSSGNANTGTCNASPTWMAGHIGGGAMTFNGTTQYVSTTLSVNYASGSPFTLSAWFNTSYAGANPTTIVGAFTGTVGQSLLRIELGEGGLGVLRGDIRGTAGNRIEVNTTGTWNDGNWHLATLVRDTSNNATLYVDGGNTAGAVAVDPIISLSGFPYYIGADDANNAAQAATFFTGSIDDVRIYNRALSTSDISQLFLYYKGRNGFFTLGR